MGKTVALGVLQCAWLAGMAMVLLSLASDVSAQDKGGETLYNGIRLPAKWPPDRPPTREPMPVPYLESPPEVIPIDVGRQLFVDNFLVQQTTLKRTYHAADYHPDNPLVAPDKPWETKGDHPCAMVFSDGVWYDPEDDVFKMWYMGGYVAATCYAVSKDGIRWEKPKLDVVDGTNIVHTQRRDSGTVWLDLEEKDPKRRYKMFVYALEKEGRAIWVYFSPDGIHWSDVVVRSVHCGDRTTVFWNPFRQVWVYGIRDYVSGLGRIRRYWEDEDAIAGAKWEKGKPPFWVGADKLDPAREDIKTPCELYNLDAVAYESLMIGLFSIWRGQPNDRAKPNEVLIAFSRDGFHWHRPMRQPLAPVSERYGDWNWANIQSAGGCCMVVGDKLYFYVSGRAGIQGSKGSGVCCTSLATIRRDGFASMDAGEETGKLTTRPVTFKGKHLFVNIDAADGELQAEVLDENGEPIAPFTQANCIPVTADSVLHAVNWKGAEDLSAVAGKPVRFRFYLRKGKLYSFWVSPERSGASQGYVAAGGPGFEGPTDTVGAAALGR